MLSKEIMGLLALGILWVNTLLIAAAAWQEISRLRALGRRLLPLSGEGTGLVAGRVVRGNGPGAAIATHRVDQVGRAGAEQKGRRTIVFHDRSHSGEIYGGSVDVQGLGELEIAASEQADVWLSSEARANSAACPSDASFDSAFAEARKARGHSRAVTTAITEGSEVFVYGRVTSDGESRALTAGGDAPILIAAFDPRPWISRKVALALFFIVVEIALAGVISWIALRPPVFGTISTIGGALGLAFFLLVQPAGTWLRDELRPPSRAFVRGRWVRSAALVEGSKEPRSSLARSA